LLEQQVGILHRHLLRDVGRARHRDQELPGHHGHLDIAPQLLLGDPLALQRLLERRLIELTGKVLEGGDACDLGIDRRFGGCEALLTPKDEHRLLPDQLPHDLLVGALPEKAGHIELRLLLAKAFELAVDLSATSTELTVSSPTLTSRSPPPVTGVPVGLATPVITKAIMTRPRMASTSQEERPLRRKEIISGP
jgi:hypothetical protein